MNRHIVCKTVHVLLVFILGEFSSVDARFSQSQLADVRDRVSIERRCQVGEQMELVLPPGTAAKLDCAHLEFGLTEVFLWEAEQRIYMCCVWADGRISYNNKPVTGQQIRWVPAPPRIGFLLSVDMAGEEAHIKIYATTDKDTIQKILRDELEKFRQKKLKPIGLDEGLVGFVRLWSEVKYNFAFFDQVPELDWDKVLEEYLPKVRKQQTVLEYYLLLQECIARLNDAHTDVSPPLPWWPGIPALLVRPIEGKAVVADLAEKDEIVGAGIARGMEITHVEGRATTDVLRDDIYPYISASTQQDRDRQAYAELLRGPIGSKVNVRFRTIEGRTFEAPLTRYPRSQTMFMPPAFEYRELPDRYVYVGLSSFRDEQVVRSFNAAFEKIKQASGLIIDVRQNGGGDSSVGYAIIGYLVDSPMETSHWKTRKYMPAFRAWGEEEQWHHGTHEPVEPQHDAPFMGPVVVLTGPGTVSAAEDFLIPLHASGRAVLVGERTAGSTGQPLAVQLPGGGRARICVKRDTYPDGKEFVGVGVVPDVEVHSTQEDICAGRDTILEKAIEVIKGRARH
ncbi:MAG: hypothetical protein JSV99_07690 [Planctomycetota bacterium]|nr:MAG: hypothetical protein JSV99_07690 [Planctomycetota bacterium]